MALYYSGPRFWDLKQKQEVTVRTSIDRNRKEWIKEMTAWAEERDIPIEWCGESTHQINDDRWHQAHFLIFGEKNRMMFLLAWGGSNGK